jgi:hypothetical protein
MVASTSPYQKALDKAESFGGADLIVSQQANVFNVRGSIAPTVYSVELGEDSKLRCTCKAAEHQAVCYHLAAVWLFMVGDHATDPAEPPVALQPEPPTDSCETEGCFRRVDGPGTCQPCAHRDAPLAERCGLGVGMVGRWADEDDRILLDLFVWGVK